MSGARWPGACAQPTRIGTGSACVAEPDVSARSMLRTTADAARLMRPILGAGFGRDQPRARIAALETPGPDPPPPEGADRRLADHRVSRQRQDHAAEPVASASRD